VQRALLEAPGQPPILAEDYTHRERNAMERVDLT
jgi:hypothetical protein